MKAVAPVSEETVRENTTVVRAVTVIVGTSEWSENRLQRLRVKRSHRLGKPGKVRNAEHSYIASTPRLRAQPIDKIADVSDFKRPHKLIEAFGLPSAPNIENGVHVPAPGEEGRVAALHIAAHWREANGANRRRLQVL